MSFNLAIWEGSRPRTDEEGLAEFRRLHAKYLEDGVSVEPYPHAPGLLPPQVSGAGHVPQLRKPPQPSPIVPQ